MLRTRNSFKRASSNEKADIKKKKLINEREVDDDDDDLEDDTEEKSVFDDDTDQDSDYRPKKDEKPSSSSDYDEADGETTSKFFKSSNKSLIKSSSKNLTKFVEKYKNINNSPRIQKTTPKKFIKREKFGHNLESDSSSDEYERAPFSLEELGEFKKIKTTVKDEDNSENTSNSDNDNKKVKESDYFDFSQIIERQELLKSVMTLKNENDKANSEVDRTKDINKRYIRKKVRRSCKKDAVEDENIDKNSSEMNVMELLKLGEGTSQLKDEDFDEYEDFSTDDMVSRMKQNKPKNIQVTIELPGVERKKEKKKSDVEDAIKRRFNLIKKENQIYAHKVHLLCWIAHGNYVNAILNSETLIGIALSLIPSKHCYPPKRCDLNYLEKLVEWYVGKIRILNEDEREKISINSNLLESLEEQFMKQVAYSRKDLALLFVCMVRALGLTARLIVNLRPVPLKPPINELISISNKPLDSKNDKKSSKSVSIDKDKESTKGVKSKKPPKASTSKYFNGKSDDDKKSKKSNYFKDDKTSDKNETSSKKPRAATEKKIAGRKQPLRGKKSLKDKIDNKVVNDKRTKLEDDVDFLASDLDDSDNDENYDFVPEKKVKRKPRKSGDKIDRRVLSTDDEEDKTKNFNKKKSKKTIDEWAEVFLEAEEKWICADLIRGKIHCTQHLYAAASTPVTYVLGWENNRSIKDVTRRYVPHWMTVTRKQRIEPEWWEETIRPYAPPNNARNREEDEDLDRQLEDQPLPASVSEYKNHPLYALKRHLLKFQAIYPPDAPTVGFIKNEPVYSRACVVELHTRESWIKEAKLVRVGVEPYKIVKARPKYDKMTGTVIKDLPLNLYGYWQVDDYIPPPAVDGKVPRNEYGNVELYKECMLPAGTVHLQLPGLNRVARKLNIDCASAVVGWDFHGGGSHPVLDGFIVCEEFKDKLLDAWNQEIDESAKRARDKVEQRIYGNWRRIIKGVLIREKLKLRYGFEELTEETKSKKKHPPKKSTKK